MDDLHNLNTKKEEDGRRQPRQPAMPMGVRVRRWVLSRSGYIVLGLITLQIIVGATKDYLGL